jgi:hypothetical protein
MGPESKKQPKTKPHLIIWVKKGWHFNEESYQFVSDEGQCVETKADLPAGTRLEYRVPELVQKSPDLLSKDEADLLRYFNIMLPPGSTPSEWLVIVKKWPCVQDLHLPPEVSLPNKP